MWLTGKDSAILFLSNCSFLRSTMEAIFLIRQVMERYKEKKKDVHMVFIDLEKAYDKISRNVMW